MNINTQPPTGPQQPVPPQPARGSQRANSNNATAKRAANPHNFYPTPPHAVAALLDKEVFPGSIWEPCAGVGHVTRVLYARGYTNVWQTDIVSHHGYPLNQTGDFLTLTRTVDHVVTNPPFVHAENMAKHALQQATGKVAFLLRLAFLESAVRKDFFDKHPPARIWVFRNRLTLYPHHTLAAAAQDGAITSAAGKPKGSKTGTQAYAWYVWDTSHRGRPAIDWLDNTPQSTVL